MSAVSSVDQSLNFPLGGFLLCTSVGAVVNVVVVIGVADAVVVVVVVVVVADAVSIFVFLHTYSSTNLDHVPVVIVVVVMLFNSDILSMVCISSNKIFINKVERKLPKELKNILVTP
jgi:hypothetical protein